MRRLVELFLTHRCYKIANYYIDRGNKYKNKAKKWLDRGNKFFESEV